MAIAHIQGASQYSTLDTLNISLNGVTQGNCLVVSFGSNELQALAKSFPVVTDNKGNNWEIALTSPTSTKISGLQSRLIYTFVATNCVAGNTTVTVTMNYGGTTQIGCTIDEYSGVAAFQAINKQTFAGTIWGSGITTLDSGSIPTTSGELLYSFAFTDIPGNGFSPTAGFTQRQINNGIKVSVASFDAIASGGSSSNTVSVSGTVPGTFHVILLSLSSTPQSGNKPIQWSAFANSSISSPSSAAVFPYPNTAGNLLVACGFFYERLTPSFSDTAGNTWTLVYGSGAPTNTFAVAYCLSCVGGPNTVTMNTSGGGTDNSLGICIMEYPPVQSYISSSYGTTTGTSVNTGDVGVVNAPALLISFFFGNVGASLNFNIACPPANTNPGTRRFQFSDSGFLQQSPRTLAIADQVASSPGNYSDTFDVSPDSIPLESAILGFVLPPTPPPPKNKQRVFSVIVPIQRQISHLVYDTHSGAWYPDQYSGAEITMHYSVPQRDPSHETFVFKGDTEGNVLVETPQTDDNGHPINCVVGTREANPGGWAYSWFENPGIDLLPTEATALSVQAASLGSVIGAPSSFQGSTRITQGIVDTGGGQPLKSMGLKFTWTQNYSGGEVLPVTLYMMQWLAVPYPEPILNQRTKGTSHGLRGFQHLFMGQLAYVSPSGPVTITLQYDQPGGAGQTATIILPATATVGPDPIKQMFKIPPNKWKIVSYDIAADTQFFLWPHDCEMWLKEWGSESEYVIVRPWGGAGEEPIA